MSDSPADRVDEHVVFFTTALSEPAAERYPSLRAAVSRVESLCNEHDVRDATVFRLVPVPLNVRSYYRVEIDADRADPAPSDAGRPSAPRDERPAPSDGDRPEAPDALDARDVRMLRERRPMREMRDEVAPQPRSGEPAPALAEVSAASDADGEPAAPVEEAERGRSLGFFIR